MEVTIGAKLKAEYSSEDHFKAFDRWLGRATRWRKKGKKMNGDEKGDVEWRK